MAGAPQTAARRARAALASLRTPGGTWRRMACLAPAGHEVQIYFGEDRSPQQQKVEATLRRAQRALGSMHPFLEARQLRREGVLAIGWQRLMRIEAPTRDDLAVTWNNALVASLAIDKAAILALLQAPAGGAEGVRWAS